MPQATYLCVDSSDYMRNGDYAPNRIMAVQEACGLLCEAMMQKNPENVIGFLTFGGKQCSVRETLTEDIDRVTGSLASIAVGGESLFGYGVQIAMLALSHVKNTRSEKQIVAFVGSPVRDSQERLVQLAKALRKDDVGISVVSLGVPGNTPLLNTFVDAVGRNAYLYVVPEGHTVIDFLFTTALMGGDGAGVGVAGTSAGAGGMGGTALGRDADDPQMAMALRASMEEEQRRQAAAAAANSGGQSSSSGGGNSAQNNNVSNATAALPPAEDDLELALRLSMEEALREEQQHANQGTSSSTGTATTQDGGVATSSSSSSSGTTAPTTTANATAGTKNNNNELAEFEAAVLDPDVMAALEKIAEDDDKSKKKEDKK